MVIVVVVRLEFCFRLISFSVVCCALVWFGWLVLSSIVQGSIFRSEFNQWIGIIFYRESIWQKVYNFLLKERKKAEIYTNILVSIDSKCKILFQSFWF